MLHRVGGLTDGRVLHVLADEMDARSACPTSCRPARRSPGSARSPAAPPHRRSTPPLTPTAGAGEALLASWHWLLDDGSLQDGEPFLAGTAKSPRLHLSAATAAEIGAVEGVPSRCRPTAAA